MARLDPIALARTQLESDREIDRVARGLFAAKRERMSASAFSFLRGSAPLFYRLLRSEPFLARGPEGRAWLTGDLHVQNFGAYRSDDRAGHDRVVFGPNDFDEACIGPVRLDVLRLATSWLLALDERGTSAADRIASCRALLDGWAEGALGGRAAPGPVPTCVTKLIERVAGQTKDAWMRDHTRRDRHGCRLHHDARLWPISSSLTRRVRAAFEAYGARAATRFHESPESFEVIDVARRVAGTGSLGVERFAVLARGGARGEWLFDVKEEPARSASGLGAAGLSGAARVVRGIETSAPAPPRMLGTARLSRSRSAPLSLLVRRLSPQEDKLDPRAAAPDELDPLGHHLGRLAGRMHRRGALGSLGRTWPRAERDALLERAITLAGIHEAAHLAYVSAR